MRGQDDARFIEQMVMTENKYIEETNDISIDVNERYMYDAANELALSVIVGDIFDNIQYAIVDDYLSNLYPDKYDGSTHTVMEAISDYELSSLKRDTVYNVLMNKPSDGSLNGISVSSVFVDGFQNKILLDNSTGMFPIRMEDGTSVDTKVINVSELGNDISKFLRVYVNYKKDKDNGNGIVLYFNYENYYNTPFVRILNNRTYSDIIDGTYLKLRPG